MARADCLTTATASDAQAILEGVLDTLAAAALPSAVRHCCDTGLACFAGPSIDAATCPYELFGTLGAPGTVCDGATGDCVAPPGSGGLCCELPFAVCVAGSNVDASTCTTVDGTPRPSSVCSPSGACVAP